MEDKQKVIDWLEKLSRMNVQGFYVSYLVGQTALPKKIVMEVLEEWTNNNKISVRYILDSPELRSSFHKVYDKIEDIPFGEICDESPFEDEFEIEESLIKAQYYFTKEQRIKKRNEKSEEKIDKQKIKQVLNISSQEFTYDSDETRRKHVAAMEKTGWTVVANFKRLNSNVSIFNATEDDYEWFAAFNHVQPLDLNPDRMLTQKDSKPETKDAKEERVYGSGQPNN